MREMQREIKFIFQSWLMIFDSFVTQAFKSNCGPNRLLYKIELEELKKNDDNN